METSKARGQPQKERQGCHLPLPWRGESEPTGTGCLHPGAETSLPYFSPSIGACEKVALSVEILRLLPRREGLGTDICRNCVVTPAAGIWALPPTGSCGCSGGRGKPLVLWEVEGGPQASLSAGRRGSLGQLAHLQAILVST